TCALPIVDAGVELMLHSMMVGSIVEDGRITGVVVAHKGGMSLLPATVTVDASGDGDVAARGGAAFRYGRESDHSVQPMTLFFRVRDVDDDAVAAYQANHPEERVPFEPVVEKARQDGTSSLPR